MGLFLLGVFSGLLTFPLYLKHNLPLVVQPVFVPVVSSESITLKPPHTFFFLLRSNVCRVLGLSVLLFCHMWPVTFVFSLLFPPDVGPCTPSTTPGFVQLEFAHAFR